MSDQLILKFPSRSAYKKEDFYVSPSNQEAYDFINSWPKWIKRIINIFGPSGSGKSHLASILRNKTSCLQLDPKDLNGINFSYISNNEITALYERKKHKIDEIISKIKNSGMEIYDISTDEGNLEDVFIDLTKN